MEHFNYWGPLVGGGLLGLAAFLLMLFTGRIAGISGIVGGLLTPRKGEVSWRVLFLIGMLLAGLVLLPFGWIVPDMPQIGLVWYIVAGLLVGIGTKIGNGCTSGHGICGIGRFSVRSIAATVTFMLVAALVVLVRQQWGMLG